MVCGRFFFEEINRIAVRDTAALKSTPDKDEISAGINKLDVFGEFKTIDALAGGDPLKYEMILFLDYEVVFKKLCLNKAINEYQKRLRHILNPESKKK
jgi:hypothetical protein